MARSVPPFAAIAMRDLHRRPEPLHDARAMTEPLARAEYDYTLDELADVSWRAAKNSPRFRHRQRRTTITLGIGFGVAAASVVAFAHGPSVAAVLGAGALTAIVIIAWRTLRLPAQYRRAVKRQALRRHGAGPLHCAIELHPERVLLQQPGLDLQFAWPEVLAVSVERDDVEIRARSGVLVVRGRAFANAAAREQFAATATRLQDEGRGRP
jgi:hypothetical protein